MRLAHSGATVLDFHQLPRAVTHLGRYVRDLIPSTPRASRLRERNRPESGSGHQIPALLAAGVGGKNGQDRLTDTTVAALAGLCGASVLLNRMPDLFQGRGGRCQLLLECTRPVGMCADLAAQSIEALEGIWGEHDDLGAI